MKQSIVWVMTKPSITEEIWPNKGLNLGLPNDTQALCPLVHKHMLSCQMVYFQTQNPNLGKFCRALEWKRLVYSMAFGTCILRQFVSFYGGLVIYVVSIWYVLVYCVKKNLATLRANR
jgi:hypothetical protein